MNVPQITCLIGESGVGKTRLAAQWPTPFFLNFEMGGQLTALPGGVTPNGVNIDVTDNAITELNKYLKALASTSRNENGSYTIEGKEVRSVVLDSFDAVQDICKYQILGSKTVMQQKDWGVLEALMRPVLLNLQAVAANGIPVVVIARVKVTERNEGQIGIKGWSVQGSIKQRLDYTFNEILHVMTSPRDNSRQIATQPFVFNGYRYLAKDRHQRFAGLANPGGLVKIESTDSYPDNQIPRAILGDKYYG